MEGRWIWKGWSAMPKE
ncbi:hypothetical protein OIU76_004885, partial [Salix suchowensis]